MPNANTIVPLSFVSYAHIGARALARRSTNGKVAATDAFSPDHRPHPVVRFGFAYCQLQNTETQMGIANA